MIVNIFRRTGFIMMFSFSKHNERNLEIKVIVRTATGIQIVRPLNGKATVHPQGTYTPCERRR